MQFRSFLLTLSSCVFVSAQGFSVNLPSEAFLIKLNKGLSNMSLPLTVSQGPAMNGIVYLDSNPKTHSLALKLESRPQSVTLDQIQTNGYLFVRYLVLLKDLGQLFDFDGSKVLHTAPELKADLVRKVENGVVVSQPSLHAPNGLSAGRHLAYSHSRQLRGAKAGVMDYMKAFSGDKRVDGIEFEEEMATYWTHPAMDEWCLVDVIVDVLPTNDKVMVEGVRARVWGLVDDSYLPYTKAKVGITIAGLSFASDPSSGLPNLGDYLKKREAAFQSKGVVEKIFMDGLKTSMGQYVAMPAGNQAAVSAMTPTASASN